ncbi:MAG: alpha/beta hydrolase, partial [Sphingomonas sp.]|nr:alpha/beta hydrolase [Sphingomonas sp.]
MLLLFHQAGSSKDEYAAIAPQLAADGYSALAIDARAGGDLFGPNQTVAALGGSADYA